jgi:hypothetical protein
MRVYEFLSFLAQLRKSEHGWVIPTATEALQYEFVFWAVVLLLAALLLKCRLRSLDRLEQWLKQVATKQVHCVAAIGLLVLLLRLALLPPLPIPEPIYHDEFSYLLGADTFAAGRLTNPPHPMGIHFESFSINVRPTYQSMYPPGQAAALALGLRLFGHAWFGVLLSVALMCAAICWMLQGWLPPHWALLGGLFCAMRFGIFSYWVNSYWGGAVAAAGGAVVLGAVGRLRTHGAPANVITLVAGLMVLANTRPFEGLLFSVPAILAVVVWLWRRPAWDRGLIVRGIVPALALAVLAAAGMLYYNWRGTGDVLLMPYALNHRTYHISNPFLWQKANPIPRYHHESIRVFYSFHELPDYIRSRHWWGIQELLSQRLAVYYEFFLWPVLLLAIPAGWMLLRKPERVLVLSVMAVSIAVLVQIWPAHPHYAAPALSAVVAIVLSGLRSLRRWQIAGAPVGRAVSQAFVVAVCVWSIVPVAEKLFDPWQLSDNPLAALRRLDRPRMQAHLERIPGQHLVIVHYGPREAPSNEWTYNRADIDTSRVIWARDMGLKGNADLLKYFRDRQVWYVDRADILNMLRPYVLGNTSPPCPRSIDLFTGGAYAPN